MLLHVGPDRSASKYLAVACVTLVPALALPASALARVTNAKIAPMTVTSSKPATLRFRSSTASRISLTLDVERVGRFTNAAGCGRPSGKNKGGRPCTYLSHVPGKRSVQARKGNNSVTITRRWPGRTLRRGLYRITLRTGSAFQGSLAFSVR